MANYSYLADGTKLAAVDAAGNGLIYSGSLVYRKHNGSLSLENASVDGDASLRRKPQTARHSCHATTSPTTSEASGPSSTTQATYSSTTHSECLDQNYYPQ